MEQIEYGNWKPATGGAASLDELAKATYDEGIHTSNLNASGVNLTEELDKVNDRIKQATGADLFHPYRPFGATPAPYDMTSMGTPDGASLHPSVTMPKWKQAVRDLATKFPDALPWDMLADEPERKAWEHMKAAREASNEVSERRGLVDSKDVPILGSIPVVKQTLGTAAAFGANAVRDPAAAWTQLSRSLMAQMTSPMDAAANLVGFGLPGAAARSLLKNAAFNGLTNAGVQIPISAYKQGDYKQAGLPYGLEVMLEEVGGAFGTGFALDAGVRGPGRAAISRFGRDVAPDQMLSRNTPRGGLLLDAIEKPDVPAPRQPSVAVARETIEAAAGGDIKATREILEKTGAIHDPEIRGALDRVERGERLDAEALNALEQMGVARGDGIRMVHDALIHGSAPAEMPAPVRQAAEPMAPQDGARLIGEIGAALQAMPARMAEAVQDGLEAGVPSIVRAVREAVAGHSERNRSALATISQELRSKIERQSPDAERAARLLRAMPSDAASASDGRLSVWRDWVTSMEGSDVRRAGSQIEATFVEPALMRQAGSLGEDGLPLPSLAVRERLAEAIANIEPRAWAEAQMHSGRASAVEMAATIRQFPDVIDSNVSLETDRMQHARAIARLDDAAYQAVANGAVPAPVAAMVADLVPRQHQARVIADLERARPASLDEARAFIGDLIPEPRQDGPSLDGGGTRIDDVQGPAAKAQTETLRMEAGDRYEAAMAPILKRDELDSKAEALKGELAKLEEMSSDKSRQATTGDATKQIEANAVKVAAKRAELHAVETELATVKAELDQSAGGQSLARLAMRAIDMRREQDVLRAVNDALALGQRIVPEGTKVEVLPDDAMIRQGADGTRYQLDGTSDVQTAHIQLAMNAIDPAAKMGHEAVHTLVTLGHISPDEVAALAKLAREVGTFKDEAKYQTAYAERPDMARVIEEEAAASYIEARIKGTAEGPANTTIERIKQLIERIKQLLAGYGFQSREDIVNALLSGEMARREARAEWGRNAQAAMRAEDITAAASKDGKLYAFAGERARTADLAALARAKEMDASNEDRTAIWNSTGWFKGVDGKWRFEIDDSLSIFRGLRGEEHQRARDYLVHPQMYDAYPDLGSILVHEREGADSGYSPRYDVIGIGREAPKKAATLHELAHGMQGREGFAEGGGIDIARSVYPRISGEVEAHTVEKRMDMTPSERRARPPWLDYDVPEADQIVRMPEQDKLFAISDRDTGQSMRRDMDSLGYYSKALEAARGLKQAKGTPEQMLAQLKSAGVKEAEIEATGLGEFLKGFGSTSALESTAITLPPKSKIVHNVDMKALKSKWFDVDEPMFNGSWGKISDEIRAEDTDATPAYWLTPSREEAEIYHEVARLQDYADPNDGPVTHKVYVRPGKQFVVDKSMKYKRDNDGNLVFDQAYFDYTVKSSRDFGYDSVRFESVVDMSPVPHDQVVVFDKSNIAVVETSNPAAEPQGDRTASPPRRASLKQVTKAEIVKHLEDNRVQVKEVQYSRGDDPVQHEIDEIIDHGRSIRDRETGERGQFEYSGKLYETRDDAVDAATEMADRVRQQGDIHDDTKWSQYSLDPSNPTYRETVLHLPESRRAQEIEARMKENQRVIYDISEQAKDLTANPDFAPLRAARSENAALLNELKQINAGKFQSGHFPEPNIIGHMMTSMTTHEGRPVFTVDQIQSDWGQKLRDGGVRDEEKIADLKTRSEAMQPALDEARRNLRAAEARDMGSEETRAAQAELSRVVSDKRLIMAELSTAEAASPGNPLVNTTDQWTNTTLRRAIRQAAEADAHYIAIPSGDTVLSYNPGDTEGMRGFYDKIVPKNLRNLLQKIDKASPAPQRIETLDSPSGKTGLGQGFTLFELTDAVKRSVVDDGQQLFSLRDDSPDARKAEPSLKSDMAQVNRIGAVMRDLVEACRA